MSNACYIGDSFKVLKDFLNFKKGRVYKCVDGGPNWLELQHTDDPDYTGVFYYGYSPQTNEVVPVGNDAQKDGRIVISLPTGNILVLEEYNPPAVLNLVWVLKNSRGERIRYLNEYESEMVRAAYEVGRSNGKA